MERGRILRHASVYLLIDGKLRKASLLGAPEGPIGDGVISTANLDSVRQAIAKQAQGIDSSTPTLEPLPTTTTQAGETSGGA